MKPETQYMDSIVRPLLQKPEDLSIAWKKDEMGILLTINVAAEDMGRIIGRNGDTARAIRRLIRQYALTCGEKIAIKINEPNK